MYTLRSRGQFSGNNFKAYSSQCQRSCDVRLRLYFPRRLLFLSSVWDMTWLRQLYLPVMSRLLRDTSIIAHILLPSFSHSCPTGDCSFSEESMIQRTFRIFCENNCMRHWLDCFRTYLYLRVFI